MPDTANRIFLGDNLDLLRRLPDGGADRGIRLVYIDPPFNTGIAQSRARLATVRDPAGDRTGFGGHRYATTRLGVDVIPRAVDDYLGFLEAFPRQAPKERLGNPVWHIHAGDPPPPETLRAGEGGSGVTFGMLLNLATVASSEDPQVLWGFLRRYAPETSPQKNPRLDRLVGYAVRYFRDFVRPAKSYRAPDEVEAAALRDLDAMLSGLPQEAQQAPTAEAIQAALYDVARAIPRYQDLRAKGATPERPGVSNDFFSMLYAVLLGEARGPRFGSFIALYGVDNARALIADALGGKFLKPTEAA
jgi:lysyl-tRNA synthetase class 1